jgi:hypothetical protein
VVKPSAVDAVQQKALEIQGDQKKYSYTLLGVSLLKKKVLNCARFGEVILQAGGISASAGDVFKLPSTLASGDDVGHTQDQDFLNEEQRKIEEAKQQQAAAAQLRQQADANLQLYAKVPQLSRGATFAENKKIMGSVDEDSPLNVQYTFVQARTSETEIPVRVFRVLVTDDMKQKGRGKIELPADSAYKTQSVYASLGDLFNPDGSIKTS